MIKFRLFSLIIVSMMLSLPVSVLATEIAVEQQPIKDDIPYLKQDAPVFELTIPKLRSTFNHQHPQLPINEYKVITNNNIAIPLVRAATRISPNLYSSAVLERGSEKIKSLQLTLIHNPNEPEQEKKNRQIATQYITALVAQFDSSITPKQIQQVLDLFAFKSRNTQNYVSHNVGAIRYVIAHEGTELTTFAIEPVKLSLNGNIDSAIP